MNLGKNIRNFIPQKYKNKIHLLQAIFAVIFFRYPAQKLTVIGVTGTDGKTTTSTLIYQFLKAKGFKVALVSSVAAYIGEDEIDTGFHVTTPDSFKLQKLLRKIVDLNYKYIVLETTSHGLDQYRVYGCNIKIAVLTNITREHLDYHKNYDRYIEAKSKIFKDADVAIINKADKSFGLIKKFINPSTKILPYDEKSLPQDLKKAVKEKFPENYNQQNAAAASIAAKELGVDSQTIIRAIRDFKGVPGRMEEIRNSKGIRIIIDFAHTPNALKMVLTALKNQKKSGQKLISIFGCASERDETKRPVMGKISAELADVSVLTAEDPRYEDINKIIGEIAGGTLDDRDVKEAFRNENISDTIRKSNMHYFIKIPERGEAISYSINNIARRGDIVVMCGKGHEKSMSYDGKEYPWSDLKAVQLALKGRVLEVKRPGFKT